MTGEERTDRDLASRTLQGDRKAFATLHKRYYARIFRLSLFRCRSQADAEDIASETFVRAIAHLPGYRFQGESLYPWLSRIANNLVADLGRKNAGAITLSLDTASAEGVRAYLENLPGGAPDPHVLAERQEMQESLRAAISRLSADQSEAVLLRFGGDLSLKEIGSAMNKSEGAIKSLLHRALIHLRRELISTEQEAVKFQHWRRTTTESEPTRTVSAYGDFARNRENRG
jgi:RNA polymerase sigma-70 factor (ECF subfamily)